MAQGGVLPAAGFLGAALDDYAGGVGLRRGVVGGGVSGTAQRFLHLGGGGAVVYGGLGMGGGFPLAGADEVFGVCAQPFPESVDSGGDYGDGGYGRGGLGQQFRQAQVLLETPGDYQNVRGRLAYFADDFGKFVVQRLGVELSG